MLSAAGNSASSPQGCTYTAAVVVAAAVVVVAAAVVAVVAIVAAVVAVLRRS